MLQKDFLIINKLGLHARASALFVKTSSRFSSDVKLARDDVEVNGKSIMGIMMLAASKGSSVRLTVDGPDEADAFQTISDLIENGFGEE
jgi:phosphocarrier protein HPr